MDTTEQPFYPKQIMGNIIDEPTGDNLYAYLSKFNHIDCGQVADAVAARESVPQIYRKPNLRITYIIDGKLVCSSFTGGKMEAGTDAGWIADENWLDVDQNIIQLATKTAKEYIEDNIDILIKTIIANFDFTEDIDKGLAKIDFQGYLQDIFDRFNFLPLIQRVVNNYKFDAKITEIIDNYNYVGLNNVSFKKAVEAIVDERIKASKT